MKRIIILLHVISFAAFAQTESPESVFEEAVDFAPRYIDAKKPYIQQIADTLAISDYFMPDHYPTAPGCNTASNKQQCFTQFISQHISRNLRIPDSLMDEEINDRVIITFLIEKNGLVKVENISGEHQEIKNEIEAVMKKTPKMSPAIVDGKPVAVRFAFPLNIRN